MVELCNVSYQFFHWPCRHPLNFCVNTRKTSGINAETYGPLLLDTQTPELERSAGPSTYFMAGPDFYSELPWLASESDGLEKEVLGVDNGLGLQFF